jgi:hypothetical protein
VCDITGVGALKHVVIAVFKEGRGSITITDSRLFEEGGGQCPLSDTSLRPARRTIDL